jgi:hypothetical protein
MLCLSIRQPWAHAILRGGKDIENRSWRTPVTGRVAIHAGSALTKADLVEFLLTIETLEKSGGIGPADAWLPSRDPAVVKGALPRGGIVGTVEITACVRKSASPWFFGDWGFVLRNPRPCRFVPLAGRLGFWSLPPDLQLVEVE